MVDLSIISVVVFNSLVGVLPIIMPTNYVKHLIRFFLKHKRKIRIGRDYDSLILWENNKRCISADKTEVVKYYS